MADRRPKKALTTGEAAQTLALGGIGALGLVPVMIGGLFVAGGILWAVGWSAVIIVLHWQEIKAAWRSRRFTRHLVLPIAVVVLVLLLTAAVANRDTILSWTRPPPPAPLRPDKFEYGLSSADLSKKVINFRYSNISDRPIKVPIYTYWTFIGVLTVEQQDAMFKSLIQTAKLRPPSADPERSEIEPHTSGYFTIFPYQKSWDKYGSPGTRLYVFTVLTYNDSKLKSPQYWVTEYCASTAPKEDVQNCGRHNRSWVYR